MMEFSGAFLLIVDSFSDMSDIRVGDKTHRVHWLLDHLKGALQTQTRNLTFSYCAWVAPFFFGGVCATWHGPQHTAHSTRVPSCFSAAPSKSSLFKLRLY